MNQNVTYKTPTAANDALERLLAHAMRDSGQSVKVRDFLLAWWNPDRFGPFDLRYAWSCDQAIVNDMVVVFRLAVNSCRYPDALGYEVEFVKLVNCWYPKT